MSNLKKVISGDSGLRYSDIIYYSVMENALMRDNELLKSFELSKDHFSFKINEWLINPMEMTKAMRLDVPAERCFCVCLSNKRNAPELFFRFKADVCVEIDLDALLEFLEIATQKFEGMKILHGDVNYYPPIMTAHGPDIRRAVFYKRDIYAVEDEYRIALTIPPSRRYFMGVSGERIRIFSDDTGDIHHLFISGNESWINKTYIGTYFCPR